MSARKELTVNTPRKKSLRAEERAYNKINLNIAYLSTNSLLIIQELRRRYFLQITSFLFNVLLKKNYFANLKRGTVMKSALEKFTSSLSLAIHIIGYYPFGIFILYQN